MSFKREGDDRSQLNILKKRRVADLLSNFIPEDEAALMKNGRYTCLVCSYRPVFDTVDMLTVHRKGKKHLEGLQCFYGKKARLKNEITKRQHEKYVEAEDTSQQPSSSAPLLAQTQTLTYHALLKTVPYNSCHRKTSAKSERATESSSTTPAACRQTDVSLNPSSDANIQSAAANEESRPSQDLTGCAAAVTQQDQVMTAERRRELQHYLKLKSDGWVQDWSGRWVKDDNVEFDSDEDEPDSLAHQPASD